MAKEKFFSVNGECFDKKGAKHVVTIVGRLRYGAQSLRTVKEDKDFFIYAKHPDIKQKELTMAISICHPLDEFDKDYGIKLAKSRIKHGNVLGTLYTFEPLMMTELSVMAELTLKLDFILKHIERYLPEGEMKDEELVASYKAEDGCYNMEGAKTEDIVRIADLMGEDEKISLGNGATLTKSEINDVLKKAVAAMVEEKVLTPEAEAPAPEEAPAEATAN